MKSNGSNTSVLLLICLVAIAGEGYFLNKLYHDNAELRARDTGDKNTVDTKASKEIKKHGTELRVLRVQNQDLLKLRTELRRLRPMTNELEVLRAQVKALSASATPAAVAAAAAIPRAPVVETTTDIYFAREDWTFAGFSNPEAAIQSVIWASSQGDLEVFLASLTPDGRAKLDEQAQRQNKTAEDMIAETKQGFAKLTGIRIMEQSILPDDSVMMRVQLEGQNLVERFFFKKIGDEWHLSDTKNDK